jgi:hypothetical protein
MQLQKRLLVAITLLICAICVDAFTALAPSRSDAQRSLRVSTITALALLSSPAISSVSIVTQKTIIVIVLVVLCVLGQHEGSETLRTTDSLYLGIVFLGIMYLTSEGGIDAAAKDAMSPELVDKTKNANLISLFSAMACFVGARMLGYTMTTDNVIRSRANVSGEFFYDAAPVVYSGVATFAAIFASVFVCVSGFAGVLASTYSFPDCNDTACLIERFAAFGVKLLLTLGTAISASKADSLRLLDVLFGPLACVDCPASTQARRENVVLYADAAVFCCALAANSLAETTSTSKQSWFELGFSGVCLLGIIVTLAYFETDLLDVVFYVIASASILFSSFLESSNLVAAVLLLDLAHNVYLHGVSAMQHLTHVSNACASILALLAYSGVFSKTTLGFLKQSSRAIWFALSVASVFLLSIYTGAIATEYSAEDVAKTLGIRYNLIHFLPSLASQTPYEDTSLPRSRFAFAAPVAVVLLNVLFLLVSAAPPPTSSLVSPSALGVSLVLGLVSLGAYLY